MKASTTIILAGAAAGVYMLIRSRASMAGQTDQQIGARNLIGKVPLIRFAAQDPASDVNVTNYYVNNPDAQPWDFLKLL